MLSAACSAIDSRSSWQPPVRCAHASPIVRASADGALTPGSAGSVASQAAISASATKAEIATHSIGNGGVRSAAATGPPASSRTSAK